MAKKENNISPQNHSNSLKLITECSATRQKKEPLKKNFPAGQLCTCNVPFCKSDFRISMAKNKNKILPQNQSNSLKIITECSATRQKKHPLKNFSLRGIFRRA
eukprot:TRINITY_DN13884_c0_g1_i6.p2 TRINITY_DN13884_c0_g1~~TRINITY_DN13884_c0_g1_i6.p2  ORF type:complete len:103 (-),score=13.79 TRINITY_DN13884_c0_g1_i6:62-370(-)